jgi:TonB family protein
MRRRLVIPLLAFATLGATPTEAQTEAEQQAAVAKVLAAADPAATPPLLEPKFKRAGYDELGPPGGYFPDRAARMGQSGVAVLQCNVASNGRLKKCDVLAVAPKGFFFEDAALRMAEVGHMTVAPVAGAADQPARIVVKFPRPAPSAVWR